MMKDVVAINCTVKDDGTVIPDPGFGGDPTSDGPFHGDCEFRHYPARGKTKAMLICDTEEDEATVVPVVYTPFWNMGWLDWEIELFSGGTTVFDNVNVVSLQSGDSGSGYSMFAGVDTAWIELKRLYFFRYRGEVGPLTNPDPALQYDGINNVSQPGSVTITAELIDRYYSVDGDLAYTESSTPQTWTVPLIAGMALPADYFGAAITDAEIETFGQIDISGTKVYDTHYPSTWPEHHFYYANFAFTYP